MVNILGGHNIGHSDQKVYIYMCPIPNGFPNRAISLYSTLYRQATGHVLTRVAKCIDVDAGILENVLYQVTMLGGSFVTTAWRVLRLRMEETHSSFGGKLRKY
jgi:hypothetical protein